MHATVDLHVHTTASDGSVSPTDVIRMAAQKKLRAIAITDHDTTDGIAEAQHAGAQFGVEIIPGIELSTHVEGMGSVHMLGLWIDPNDVALQVVLKELREGRMVRNQNILKSLADLSVPIDPADVSRHAGGKVVGRLHIASAMIDRGYITSYKEAFERYLGYGKPAYWGRKRLEAPEAIKLIRNASGVAVLAHPGILKVEHDKLEIEIKRLIECGLGGLEAIHTDHSAADTVFFKLLATRYGVAISGGSDFHGDPKPGIEIDSQSVPYELLSGLLRMREARPDGASS